MSEVDMVEYRAAVDAFLDELQKALQIEEDRLIELCLNPAPWF